jgi:hypothetical protein
MTAPMLGFRPGHTLCLPTQMAHHARAEAFGLCDRTCCSDPEGDLDPGLVHALSRSRAYLGWLLLRPGT